MTIKELIFGSVGAAGGSDGVFADSIQAWLPVKNIIGGVVITKDNRFVKILELLPVNIYLKSPEDRQNIIASFAAYLKLAPDSLQLQARTLPADTTDYVRQMEAFAEGETNAYCREMIEDNIAHIGKGIASEALRHRFFLIFQYESRMNARRNAVRQIVERLNEEAVAPAKTSTAPLTSHFFPFSVNSPSCISARKYRSQPLGTPFSSASNSSMKISGI